MHHPNVNNNNNNTRETELATRRTFLCERYARILDYEAEHTQMHLLRLQDFIVMCVTLTKSSCWQ